MYMPDSPVQRHHIASYGDPSAWPCHFFIEGGHDKSGRFVKFAPRPAGGAFGHVTFLRSIQAAPLLSQ
jgi:alpha-L-fucosidase